MTLRWARVGLSLLCWGTLSGGMCAQDVSVAQHEQRAQEYLRARQPEMARKEFEIVAAAQPGNLDAQANLGVLLYFSNDVKQAEPHLRAALALDPKQAKLQALLGLCERRNGEAADARTDLRAALPQLQDPKIRRQAGLELLEMDTAAGDLASAAGVASALKAALPTDPEVLYATYRVYTDLASESLLDLSVAGPDSAQMHQAMAHELLRERDNAGAITNFRAALKADPNLPGGHFELAEVLYKSPDPALKAEAEQQYELALKQNPTDDKTLSRLGDLAASKGDHQAAIARYKAALAAEPESGDAAIGLAHELVETGQPDGAVPLLQGVIKADPSNELAHYRLSALYRRLHRTEDAKREVAEYERLKGMKEKLRTIYDSMRLSSPHSDDVKD